MLFWSTLNPLASEIILNKMALEDGQNGGQQSGGGVARWRINTNGVQQVLLFGRWRNVKKQLNGSYVNYKGDMYKLVYKNNRRLKNE